MQTKAGVFKYFITGGPISCGSMAIRFAPIAFEEINDALAATAQTDRAGQSDQFAA